MTEREPQPQDLRGFDAQMTAEGERYRDGYLNMMRLIIVESLAIAVLTMFVFYYISNVVPQDRYYAESINGSRSNLVGLSDPNINDEALLTWASEAITDIMTFGFNDIDRRMEHAKPYFSPEGWDSFIGAMQKSSMIRTAISAQQILTAIIRQPPTIVFNGMIKGNYGWIIDAPVIMTIRAGDVQKSDRVTVRLVLIKMPTQQNPMGVGIQTWTAQ